MQITSICDEIVTLEKVVSVVEKRLGIENVDSAFMAYAYPFEFYLKNAEMKSILKLSSEELFVACNDQVIDDEPLFDSVEDMMNEFEELLGGNPADLVVQELKKKHRFLICIFKG